MIQLAPPPQAIICEKAFTHREVYKLPILMHVFTNHAVHTLPHVNAVYIYPMLMHTFTHQEEQNLPSMDRRVKI